MKSVYHKFFPFVFLSFFVFCFFFRLFYPQSSLFMIPDFGESDVLHLNLPLKEFLSSSLKNNHWPLWTPNIASGFPVLAEGQIGTFYLPNLILFRFLPTVQAYNINLIITFSLAALGTYLFIKQIGLSSLTASYGAFIFTFSGYMSVHLNHYNLIQTVSLLPFLYWSILILWKKPSIKKMILFSFILTQQIFTGYFYMVYVSLLGIVIIWLMLLLVAVQNNKIFPFFNKTKFLIFGCFLSILLSSIQLVPTFEIWKLSQRSGGLSFDTTTSMPFNYRNLLSFIKPYFEGSPADGTYPIFNKNWGIFWENTAYIGLLPLLLALLSIVYFKEKVIRIFWVVLIVSLLLVLGKNSPLYFVFSFPPFNFFRVPSRYLLLTLFSLTILSAYTFDRIINRLTKSSLFLRKIIFFSFVSLIFILTIIDEYRFSYEYPPISPSEWWTKPPETVQFLKNKEGRITSLGASLLWNEVFFKKGWQDINPYVYFRNSLYPNYNILFDIPQFGFNTGGLIPRRIILTTASSLDVEFDEKKKTASISSLSQNIFSLFGVKYLISSFRVDNNPSLLKVQTVNPTANLSSIPFYIYENKESLPLTYLAFQTKKVSTLEEFQRELAKTDFAKEKKAFVENEGYLIDSQDDKKSSIKLISRENTEIVLETESQNTSMLIVTETNYPGWFASIDGKLTPILTVNLNQKGIILPSGKHLIRFFFHSQSFEIGKKITVYSWIITAIAVFLSPLLSLCKVVHNRKLSHDS